ESPAEAPRGALTVDPGCLRTGASGLWSWPPGADRQFRARVDRGPGQSARWRIVPAIERRVGEYPAGELAAPTETERSGPYRLRRMHRPRSPYRYKKSSWPIGRPLVRGVIRTSPPVAELKVHLEQFDAR